MTPWRRRSSRTRWPRRRTLRGRGDRATTARGPAAASAPEWWRQPRPESVKTAFRCIPFMHATRPHQLVKCQFHMNDSEHECYLARTSDCRLRIRILAARYVVMVNGNVSS